MMPQESKAVIVGNCHKVPGPTMVQSDRRGGPRLRTVYRVARVSAADDQGFARVLNISDEGMMLKMSLDVCVGDLLTVDLSDSYSVKGKVAWAKDGRFGIKLTARIDSAAVLSQLVRERRLEQARPMRLAHCKPVGVASQLGTQTVMLRDISQAGVSVTHDGRFTPGLPVKVRLNPAVERPGYVRWSDGGAAGIMLTEYLSVEELGSKRSI